MIKMKQSNFKLYINNVHVTIKTQDAIFNVFLKSYSYFKYIPRGQRYIARTI